LCLVAIVRRVHWLLFYDVVDDYLERRVPLRDNHLALARAAHDRGELVMAGALAEPADGAVLLFAADTPAVAEAFAQNDPYVREGIVTAWRVRQWTVVVGGDPPGQRASTDR
jgi:hypothetical protein